MAQPQSIGDAISSRGSIEAFWKLVDPENKYPYNSAIEEWYRLSLTEQRKLYLYLLYRKWRGLDIYGEPYFVIKNCHPVPFNWNGQSGIEELIKTKRVVIARYKGTYGTYTYDEARLYEMTDIQPLTKQQHS